jgi:hypothetical protein
MAARGGALTYISAVKCSAILLLGLAWTGPLTWVAGVQERPSLDTTVVGQPRSVEAVPFLTLGASAGIPEQEFFRVVTPFLFPPDKIVIPVRGHGEIRIFNLSGELVAIQGRPGEGPGEFQDLAGAWARGDTLETFDPRLSRVTRFLPDGTIQTVHLDPGGAGYRLGGAVPGGFHDGWLVTGVSGVSDSQRLVIAIARFARDGSFLETITSTEGPSVDPANRGVVPLSPLMFSAILDDELYVGETLTPMVRVLGGTGDVLREIGWEPEAVPPGQALREVIALAVQRADPSDRDSVRERLEGMPEPQRVPAYSEFMVDRLGFLWVRPYEVTSDPAGWPGVQGAFKSRAGGMWWIFTPTGSRAGSVELPPDLEPYQISVDAVVGIRRDDLGVEHVQVHRLHRW